MYSVKEGLAAQINSVLAASDQSIWVGTSAGLYRWNDGHVTKPWNPATDPSIQSIFQDSLDRVWASGTILRAVEHRWASSAKSRWKSSLNLF